MTAIHKKLIEVALPLDVINTASARVKSIRNDQPSRLHRVYHLRRPVQGELDFGVTSVNYEFFELLRRADAPK